MAVDFAKTAKSYAPALDATKSVAETAQSNCHALRRGLPLPAIACKLRKPSLKCGLLTNAFFSPVCGAGEAVLRPQGERDY
jgi:hypothetical protein